MMTYQEFTKQNPDPIINQSDETVQNAVYNWFKYRYIGFENTTKFLDILQRNVKIYYPMYKQKLRIEPGVSQYDWLVQVYRERQLKSNGEKEDNLKHFGGQYTKAMGHEDNVKSGSQLVKHHSEDKNTKSGEEILSHIGDDSNIKSGSEHTQKEGEDSNTKSGGHTQTNVSGLHTTTFSPHVKVVTSEDGGDNAWSGDTQISAVNPMSKQYSEFISVDTSDKKDPQYYEHAYEHMPKGGLNWETLSNQAQSGHREYHDTDHKTTQSYEYGDGVKGDITATQGDDAHPDKSEIIYKDEKDVTKYGSGITVEYNDLTDKQEYNSKNIRSYNGLKDENEIDGYDETQYNGVKDENNNHSENTVWANASDETKGKDRRIDREQVTGRNEDPATLLEKATAFIERSSAFMWFKEQIDSCFFPGYYTELIDGNEEGSCNI